MFLKYALNVCFALLFFVPQSVFAVTASETVQKAVDDVRVVVLKEGKGLNDEQVHQEIVKILKPVFDFREMAARSLGANWRKATPEQRSEFVDLFSDLLAENYIKKIRENLKEGEFSIVEESNKGEKALVETNFAIDGEDVKIDYRLRLKKGYWKAYDVVIENVGLVSNYRREFAGIIRKEKMEGLLKRLREK